MVTAALSPVIRFDRFAVGAGHPCFIIAEAGVNHNGELELAKQLVDVAVDAGADAVKFQTFKVDAVVSSGAPKAGYQKLTTDASETQHAMLRRLELSHDAHRDLFCHCQDRGIVLLSTPFDHDSASFLVEIGVPVLKVPSGEVTNLPFLRFLGSLGRPLILSTGMCYLGEVERAVHVLREADCDQVVLLHCVSSYPAQPADANLRAMHTLREAFGLPVGYSDHTLGIEVPLAAAALGAAIVEKHVTLDRALPGPDHQASLEPHEFKAMVNGIRLVEAALGDGRKEPTGAEIENRSTVRRSLAATVDISEGSILTAEMLTALRPGVGISPTRLDRVIGRRLVRARKAGEILSWGDLE